MTTTTYSAKLTVTDLGHENSTLLLTIYLDRPSSQPRPRRPKDADREQHRGGIDFFDTDALSSTVAMKVICNVQLTLMGSSHFRLLAARISQGYESAKSRHLFRDFISATA